MTTHDLPPGVMRGSYAVDRARRPHLAFRAEFRAQIAVDAFLARRGRAPRVNVLELGAAEGLTLAHMRRLLDCPGDSVGVEASAELIAHAVASVELVRGDIMDLPPQIEREHFELCSALAVLEHLPAPDRALAGAFRSLVPGGVFVATCPHPYWDEIASRLGLMADDSHQQHLSLDGLVELLGAAGFTRIEPQRFMFAPVAVLPYFGVRVPPRLAARIDERVRRLRWLDLGFVNQAVVAEKPR